MKRFFAAILAAVMLVTLLPTFALAASPADYGWHTDNEDFAGWTADASSVSGDYSTTHNSHRLWKHYIEDEDNFAVTLNITVDAQSSAFVKMLGVTLELDGRHGNGNQAYVKLAGSGKDWVSGTGCRMSVKIVRIGGGAMSFTVSGEGNDSSMELTAAPIESSTNVEIGLYAGKGVFSNITAGDPTPAATYTVTWSVNGSETEETYAEGAMPVYRGSTAKAPDEEFGYEFIGWEPAPAPVTADITYTAQYKSIPIGEYVPTMTPGDFGWQTDKTGGEMDFSGWTATDAANLACDYATSVNSHRVWRGLPGDAQTFTVTLTVAVNSTSSVFFKVFGQILEFDGRGGNGNQVYVKQNGKGQNWYNTMGGTVHLTMLRENGGDVKVWLAGEDTGGIYPVTISPTEQNPNFELGVYAGTAAFTDITMTAGAIYPTVTEVDLDLRSAPFETVRFTNFADGGLLEEKIAFYQKKPVTLTDAAADLEIIGFNASVLESFSAEDITNAIKALKTENNIVVAVGIPATAADVETPLLAEAQIAIREAAKAAGALCVNAWAVIKEAPWCANADGTLTETGTQLVADAVFAALCKRCTCLAARTQRELNLACAPEQIPTAEMLDGLRTCTDAATLAAILDSNCTGLDLTLYHTLDGAAQRAVCEAFLAADRSGLTDWAAADLLLETVCIQTVRAADKTPVFKGKFTSYVAVGDSITEGVGATNKDCCWANLLASMIEKVQGQPLQFRNNGVGGTTMSEIFFRGQLYQSANTTLKSYVLDYSPDLVTVSYGINDLYYGVSFEQFCTDYDQFLHTLREALPNATVLVCGLGFVGSDFRCGEILRWNAAIRQMAENYGAIYVDTYHALRTTEWLLGDALHPTDTGYYVMADTLLRTLCANCDLTDSVCAHDYAVTVTKEATETEAGEITYTCTLCGDTFTEAVPPKACPSEGYTDIDRSKWYHDAVDHVIKNGLMGSTKTDELTFEPNTKVSRAMVASILYRIAGNGETPDYQGTFQDVKAGKWYTVAVEWCAANGLASGKGSGIFDPDGFVTRQELAVFFYNLADHQGYDMTTLASLEDFPDGNKVPAWAQTALSWCAARKIISGKGVGDDVFLMPADTATRAELASILYHFPKE